MGLMGVGVIRAGGRGPASGSDRVIRGGGWDNLADGCRTAFRGNGNPTNLYNDTGIGFRSVLPPGQ